MSAVKSVKPSQNFIRMCHSIYDNIHGTQYIAKIFNPITDKQLKELIYNYNTSNVFLRYYNISKFIKKTSNLNHKGATEFYANAIQHYLYEDYDYD